MSARSTPTEIGRPLCLGLLILWSTAPLAERSLSLRVSTGYDSNPSLLAESSDGCGVWVLHPSFGVYSKDDSRYNWRLQGGYEYRNATISLQSIESRSVPGAVFFVAPPQTRDAWASAALTIPLGINRALSLTGLALSHVDSSTDQNEYFRLMLSPELRMRIGRLDRLSISAIWQNLEYHRRVLDVSPTTMQNDLLYGLALGWWHRWPGNFASEATIEFSGVDSNRENLDSAIISLQARSWWVFKERYRLASSLIYGTERLDEASLAISERPQDDSLRVAADLTYQISPRLDMGVSLIHSRRTSNEAGVGYVRNLVYLNTSLAL